MPGESLQDLVARLSGAANALAALGAALDARASGAPVPEAVAPHLDAVLDALGATDLVADVPQADLVPLLGELRTFAIGNARLPFLSSQGPGWTHVDPDLLEAAGDVSVSVPRRLKAAIAAQLPGLEGRLAAPGAAFLDVGVGVAALAIEMARLWPGLRVVGVEPLDEALALARRRIEAAGLAARIELRPGRGEDIADRDRFDLAWVPGLFIGAAALPVILRRVHEALRPSGWLLLPTIKDSNDPLATALMRLRVATFGGHVSTPGAVRAMASEAGFASVAMLPSPPASTGAMIVGRKAG